MGRSLARLGSKVSIYAFAHPRAKALIPVPQRLPADLDVDGVHVRAFRRLRSGGMGLSLPLSRQLRRNVGRYDIVHIHSLYLFHAWAAAWACWRAGMPYIVRPHGTLDPYIHRRHRWRKAVAETLFQNRVLHRAAAIHYTSAEEMRLAEPFAQAAPGVIVPLGVDMDAFAKLPSSDALLQRHPELGTRRVELFLGRLHEKKGLDLLVPAFAHALAAGHDLHLVLAGPDDGMGGKVREWAAGAGVADRVTLTGMLQGDDRPAAFAAAELFVLPSYNENFGLAVVEAIAAGVPVVVSNRVNIWREIEADGAGRVVPRDGARLGQVLVEMVSDRAALARMSEAARKSAAARYNWDRVGAALERVYQDIIDSVRHQ